jgi:phosphomannomutase
MIPGHIFREYDIRGFHETELTDPVAEAVGGAFATLIREGAPATGPAMAIALGATFGPAARPADAVERGVRAAGVAVDRRGALPTPALYYAVAARGLDGGLQITGSHNPPEFNGFKMTARQRPIFGADIQRMRDRIESGALRAAGGGRAADRPVLDEYRAMLVERLRSAKGLRVVMDCGNGCAGTVVPEVFEQMGHSIFPLYAELDGRFPNTCPIRPSRAAESPTRSGGPVRTSGSASTAMPTGSGPWMRTDGSYSATSCSRSSPATC